MYPHTKMEPTTVDLGGEPAGGFGVRPRMFEIDERRDVLGFAIWKIATINYGLARAAGCHFSLELGGTHAGHGVVIDPSRTLRTT